MMAHFILGFLRNDTVSISRRISTPHIKKNFDPELLVVVFAHATPFVSDLFPAVFFIPSKSLNY